MNIPQMMWRYVITTRSLRNWGRIQSNSLQGLNQTRTLPYDDIEYILRPGSVKSNLKVYKIYRQDCNFATVNRDKFLPDLTEQCLQGVLTRLGASCKEATTWTAQGLQDRHVHGPAFAAPEHLPIRRLLRPQTRHGDEAQRCPDFAWHAFATTFSNSMLRRRRTTQTQTSALSRLRRSSGGEPPREPAEVQHLPTSAREPDDREVSHSTRQEDPWATRPHGLGQLTFGPTAFHSHASMEGRLCPSCEGSEVQWAPESCQLSR